MPKLIKSVSTIKDQESKETLIYIMEYEEGGFCLVSGDSRFDPISRWRQGGSFNYYAPADPDCECDRAPAGCGPIALAMLMRYHESPVMNMAFNGDSSYTDYSNMPLYAGSCSDNTGGYKSSAMLVALCVSVMNSIYGIGDCNTATFTNKIGDGLDWFGYTHDGKGDLDDRYNAISYDLKFGYPVILTGSIYSWVPWENWHIWLADGINEQYSEFWADNGSCQDIWNGASPASCGVCPDCVTCFIYHTTEWHMNWGQDGDNNGWYNASHTTIGVYSHYMRAYTNIRP